MSRKRKMDFQEMMVGMSMLGRQIQDGADPKFVEMCLEGLRVDLRYCSEADCLEARDLWTKVMELCKKVQ